MRLSRLWLALVVVAFCLPLFVGLGTPDLESDEAIYSFSVERILEIGDWLEPRSSPSETAIFLEKPPLKFWLVAAPIKAGLLPHNEFGLRFLDAVAGALSFVYVFAIGSLLAGPVCGAVAVLLLFIHEPLVFAHGLRTNNMEASLVLCYCGGVFHFLRWSALEDARARRRHVLWATLYFVLGFMTKFVAALFLPLALAIALFGSRRVRHRLFEDWRTWLAAFGLFVALSAPWFIYAHVRFGWLLWETILGEHVVRRMTSYLDPTHLHPWYYYLQIMWQQFVIQQTEWLIVAGAVVLLVQSVRRRWFEGAVVLLWAILPLAIISAGSSKLYHYAYPFLPPLALAGGYLVSLVVMLAPAPFRRLLESIEDRVARAWPSVAARLTGAASRRMASAFVVLAATVAIVALLVGGLRLDVGGLHVKSSGAVRPVLLMVLAGLVTRTSARVARLAVMLLVFSTMPMAAYRGQLERFPAGKAPMRAASECVQRVQAQSGSNAGILIDVPEGVWHPLYYYFRRVRPVSIATSPFDPAIAHYLDEPAAARPVLMSEATWDAYSAQRRKDVVGSPAAGVSPPMLTFYKTVLLLPGPYAACSSEAVLRNPRP